MQAASDGAVDHRTTDVNLQTGEVTGVGLKRHIDFALERVAEARPDSILLSR
jgi:hypothetical protein